LGLRFSLEIAADMYNYGHFQVLCEDGWHAAGWGPMMSDTACFMKDLAHPKGTVSFRMPEDGRSDDVYRRFKTAILLLHRMGLTVQDLSMAGGPGHRELSEREQAFVARAIVEDLDVTRHLHDAVQSLANCPAADESVRSGKPVRL